MVKGSCQLSVSGCLTTENSELRTESGVLTMPSKRKPPALLGGPYQAPPFEPGSSLVCRIRGRQTVAGVTGAPYPWPYCYREGGGGPRILIVCGGLEAAIRAESAQAICYFWGVGRHLVSEWRRALGVGRMTPGTIVRWRELAPRKLPRAARRRGGAEAARRRQVSTRGEP